MVLLIFSIYRVVLVKHIILTDKNWFFSYSMYQVHCTYMRQTYIFFKICILLCIFFSSVLISYCYKLLLYIIYYEPFLCGSLHITLRLQYIVSLYVASNMVRNGIYFAQLACRCVSKHSIIRVKRLFFIKKMCARSNVKIRIQKYANQPELLNFLRYVFVY